MNKDKKMLAIAVAIGIIPIVIILVVILIKKTRGKSVSNFENEAPRSYYDKLVEEFGEPTTVVNKKHGAAIWTMKGIYENIMLIDESITHNEPKKHCDFLYATVRVHIPDEHMGNVLGLSKSLTYDQLKNTLTVRCGSIRANVVTLYLSLMIINDSKNVEKYYDSYGEYMQSVKNDSFYETIYQKLEGLLKENQLLYGELNPMEHCEKE